MSTTAGSEASDQDESQPEPRDSEEPEGRKLAVAGVENWHDARGPGQYVRARRGPGASRMRRTRELQTRVKLSLLSAFPKCGTPPLHRVTISRSPCGRVNGRG
jgi:hypothetical protein